MSAAKKKVAVTENVKPQRFFSVVANGILPGHSHKSYQIEVVETLGSEITKRYLYGKVDTKQQTMANLELINDPDNQEFEGKEVYEV